MRPQSRQAIGKEVLDDESIAIIRAAAQEQRYPRGAVIWGLGAPHSPVYLLGRGRVRLYRTTAAGHDITLYYLHAGDAFGLIAGDAFGLATDDGSGAAAMTALVGNDGAVVYRLVRPHLEQLMATHPAVALYVVRQLSRRWSEACTRLAELAGDPVEVRLAHALARLVATNSEGTARERPWVAVTNAELAALVGTTRERVTKLLTQFRQRGWIALGRRHGVIHVLDVAALAKLE